ncbi:MAG: hypothetical protein NTV39_01055 [Candidatus Saccharibacteria bacterium]|nr:hypothetical protein [Candidatus Saccharibacteria bacterium]
MNNKLEIYKMAAELADRVSARRMAANGFFLTINTTLVGLLGFMYSELADDKRAVLLVMSMTGILLSSTWFFAIRSYKRLNKAKFQVINKMEKDLPYQNFTDEWDQLKRTTKDDGDVINVRRWWLKFKDIYTDLTNIEAVVPILFGLIYLFIFIGSAFKVIIK